MNFAYVCLVTNSEEEYQQQYAALRTHSIDRWFEDVQKKIEWNKLMSVVRENDKVFVYDLSCVASSTKELVYVLNELFLKKAYLFSCKERLDTSTDKGLISYETIQFISQFEKEAFLKVQRKGIESAKKDGRFAGRKPISIRHDKFEPYYKRIKRKKATKSQIAAELNISRPTLNRIIADYEEMKNRAELYELVAKALEDY